MKKCQNSNQSKIFELQFTKVIRNLRQKQKMYTGTPKADAIPKGRSSFFDENFVGGSTLNNKHKKDIDNDFAGISSASEQDKLYKKTKSAFDSHDSELFGAPRAPLHSGASANPKGQRGNSPATGAIAGQPPASQVDAQALGLDGKDHRQSQNHNSSTTLNNCEDSFQKLYSKELDLDEDEVPLILHELNDSAIHFISKDQYDRALSLLQKAQTLLDRLMFQRNTCDRFLIQCTMHNMALCFQKMGALEECSLCLDACLNQVSSAYMQKVYKANPAQKLKKLKYECKIHMQVCALLSQLNRHQEALCHAKQSVQISQYMLQDLMEMCEMFNQKVVAAKNRESQAQEIISKGERAADQFSSMFLEGSNINMKEIENKMNKSDLIYFDEQVSMLERTAHKYYPIIQEVVKRMVRHKEVSSTDTTTKKKPEEAYQSKWIVDKTKELRANEADKTLANGINMRVLLGYLNQSEWMYLLNIGNIMQITPLTIHDLHSTSSVEIELARDAIIEKISFLAVSYFCVSTELRFLVNLKDNPNVDPVQIKSESEYWHGKALEISCTFLPSESPLVSHIFSSYKKHHAPVNQVIAEDKQIQDDQLTLKIIRPLAGIDQAKQCPMVRANKHMHIALSPLHLSPNNYLRKNIETGTNTKSKPKLKLPLTKSKASEKDQEPDIQIQDQSKKKASPKIISELKENSFIFNDDTVELPEPEANVDFNKMTTLNFRTLNEDDKQDVSLKQDIDQLEDDFKKMGLIDKENKFVGKELKQSKSQGESKRVHQVNRAVITTKNKEASSDVEQAKQMMKLEQIADLSSILKDRAGEDDTTLQSIDVGDHPDRAFDARHVPSSNQSLFQKSQDKESGAKYGLRKEEAVTIPNNEQNEKKKPKDIQQQYLKDTTIDNSLLQNQTTAEQFISQKSIKFKNRPKTSENNKRGAGERIETNEINQSRQTAGLRENDSSRQSSNKVRTSLSNNNDASEDGVHQKSSHRANESTKAPGGGKQASNNNPTNPDQQLYQHGALGPAQPSRPFTQQNFYGDRNGQMTKQDASLNNQNNNVTEGNNTGNVSSSVTSGVTSTSGVPAKSTAQNQNLNSHQQLKLDQYSLQQQYLKDANTKTSARVQSTERLPASRERHPELVGMLAPQQHIPGKQQNYSGKQGLNVQPERQVQSQRDQQYAMGTNNAHITPKNKSNYVQFPNQNQISAQQQSRYKQNNQIVNSASSSRQVQTAMGTSRNNISYNTNTLDQRKSSAAATALSSAKQKALNNKHNQSHNTITSSNIQKKGEHMEREVLQTLSPNKKSGKSQKSNKSSQNRNGPMYATGQNYLGSQQQSREGSKERERLKHMQQQVQDAKLQGQATRSKAQIISTNIDKSNQIKSARTNVQTPTQGMRPSNQAMALHISQMLQAQQAERSASNGSDSRGAAPQHYQSQQNSATKKAVKQSQLALKQQQYLLQQQALMQKMSKNSSQQNIRNSSSSRQPQPAAAGNRGGSAKNTGQKTGQISQNNQTTITRYNSNQNNLTQNQSMQDVTANTSLNQQSSLKQHMNVQKSRNSGALPTSKTQGNSGGMALTSQRGQANNQTFENDISQMRNIQMQIQSKLNNIQKVSTNPHKIKKTTKSAEKGQYPQYASAQQSGNNTSRNKLQLNMMAVGQIAHNQAVRDNNQGGNVLFVNTNNTGSGKRSGALQTVRSNEKRINFVGPNVIQQNLIIDQTNPQLNLQHLQNMNTYNTNSLETSHESNQLTLANQFSGVAQSVQFPSTPNVQSAMQSARGSIKNGSQMVVLNSSRSNQTQRGGEFPQPHIGGAQKVIGIKHTTSKQENSYELLQKRQEKGHHMNE